MYAERKFLKYFFSLIAIFLVFITGCGKMWESITTNAQPSNHANHQCTWATIDDYSPGYGYSFAIGLDSLGNLFSAGQALTTGEDWVVRSSSNSGATWTNVDDYTYPSGVLYNYAYAFTADTLGNIFVSGFGRDSARA